MLLDILIGSPDIELDPFGSRVTIECSELLKICFAVFFRIELGSLLFHRALPRIKQQQAASLGRRHVVSISIYEIDVYSLAFLYFICVA